MRGRGVLGDICEDDGPTHRRWMLASLWISALGVVLLVVAVVFALRANGGGSGASDAAVSSPSAEPTPGAAASVSRGQKGCVTQPSRCGYPDASNTGVVAGNSLRSVPADVTAGPGWHWDKRGWLEIDGSGAIIENLAVAGNVNVEASDVTIRDVRIAVSGDTFGISLRHANNATIQDTEIAGSDATAGRLLVGVKDIYGDAVGTRVERVNVFHVATGIQIYQGLIADSYIHDVGYRDGDHTNGTTSNGSAEMLTIRHNTVLNENGQTDAISLFQDFGVEANRLIDDNLVGGGAYSVYGGANPGKAATSNIRIINNRFTTKFFPNGGLYGPVTAFDPSGSGNLWSGNIWDETGLPVGL